MPLGQHTFDKLAHGRCFSMDSVLIHIFFCLVLFLSFFLGGEQRRQGVLKETSI